MEIGRNARLVDLLSVIMPNEPPVMATPENLVGVLGAKMQSWLFGSADLKIYQTSRS